MLPTVNLDWLIFREEFLQSKKITNFASITLKFKLATLVVLLVIVRGHLDLTIIRARQGRGFFALYLFVLWKTNEATLSKKNVRNILHP